MDEDAEYEAKEEAWLEQQEREAKILAERLKEDNYFGVDAEEEDD